MVNGWERTTFYKPNPDFVESHGYQFANWHEVVADEVKAITQGIGLAELSGFNRFEISGAGAMQWLDSLTCSRLPESAGKVGLCYFLTNNGNIAAEATITQLSGERIWYCSAATAEYHDMDWLSERLPVDSDIRVESLTNTHTVLLLAGPKVRDLLTKVSPRTQWTQSEFPWMSAQNCFIGHIEAEVMAVSFSGEQAFEIHIPNTQLYAAYQILVQAGAAFGLTYFGNYAIESMRIEKGYGHWKADFITEFNPAEAGLDYFVDMNKAFPGKQALQQQIAKGNRRERVLLILDSSKAPAQPGEAVFADQLPVGTITSAAWGYRTNRNLAMAYVASKQATPGSQLQVLLLGERVNATVVALGLYDPTNLIPRGLAVEKS